MGGGSGSPKLPEMCVLGLTNPTFSNPQTICGLGECICAYAACMQFMRLYKRINHRYIRKRYAYWENICIYICVFAHIYAHKNKTNSRRRWQRWQKQQVVTRSRTGRQLGSAEGQSPADGQTTGSDPRPARFETFEQQSLGLGLPGVTLWPLWTVRSHIWTQNPMLDQCVRL